MCLSSIGSTDSVDPNPSIGEFDLGGRFRNLIRGGSAVGYGSQDPPQVAKSSIQAEMFSATRTISDFC